MDDLHIALLEYLFPLRSSLIGLEVVSIPKGVSSSDKAKDRVGIDIIGEREPMPEDNGLEGQDMGPTGLLSD
jgi:hypothetical protein